MANISNRLQFVHHDECFNTVEEAKNYVAQQLDKIDRPSLYAEPMILKYKNTKDETSPNILLAIGSVGDGITPNVTNRTFFIDSASIEASIATIVEELAEYTEQIKALQDLTQAMIEACGLNENGTYTAPDDSILKVSESLKQADILLSEYIQDLEKKYALYTTDTNSVALTLDKTETGQTLSADVKVANHKTVNYVEIPNIILKEENGLYANVDLEYDEENNDLVFSVNGERKTFDLPTETYLVKGVYDIKTESLILTLNTGSEITVKMEDLIEEWTVLGENSATPIILTKDHATYEEQAHVKNWQDVLHADVRIASKEAKPFNILKKTDDGRSLYVDGLAKNIQYLKDGEYITVQEAIDTVKCAVSPSNDNIIYRRQDGIFAKVDLTYNSATNVLTFKHTTVDGQIESTNFELNSAKLLEDVSYDSTREVLILRFTTADGKYSKVEIPVKDIIEEWDVDNTHTTVTLNRTRGIAGEDKLSANVNISNAEYNIVEDNGHAIYVRGTADNIRFDEDYTVEGKIKDINKKLAASVEEETTRAKEAESNLNNKIEAVKTTLGEETIRAEKAEEKLTEAIADEITRATNAENQLEREIQTNAKAIADETKRAITDENIISGIAETNKADIAKEVTRASKAEAKLEDAINTEISDRENAITTITHKLDDEIATARQAEQNLSTKLQEVSTLANKTSVDLTSEINRAQTQEIALNTAIEKEVTRAKTDEQVISGVAKTNKENIENLQTITNDLRTDLTAETNRATAIETSIKADLASEVTRAKNTENTINGALTNEITTARANETLLENSITATNTKLTNETTRATTAEQLLSEEITRVDNALTAETNRATASEVALNTAITSETHNRETEIVRVEKLISDEEERAMRVEDELNDKIGDVDEDLTDEVKRAKGVELEISGKTDTNANAIQAETTRAELAEHDLLDTIKTVSGDLKSDIDDIDVSYNAASNVLTVTTPNGTKEYTLTEASLIDHIEYISSTKTLRIYYKVTGEGGQTKYVDIEVTDLFNQLALDTTKSEAGAVHLELLIDTTVGNDILSAEVKISDAPSNALVNDNGNLYVSNQAANIKLADGTSVVDALNGITADINEEIQNRIDGDASVLSEVNKETTRAKGAEQALTEAIASEENERKQKDNDLDRKISDEITRATGVEDAITAVTTALDTRLDAVENGLTKEISDRILSETNIKNSIDNLQSDLETEATTRENADKALDDRIKVVETSAITINTALSNEVTKRESEDVKLQQAITAEATRADSAEKELNTKIQATNVDLTNTKEKVEAVATSADTINSNLIQEKADRLAGDNESKTLIHEEEVRAKEEEEKLSDAILAGDIEVKNLVTAEATRADNAEKALSQSIKDGDKTLELLIQAETTRAEAKENALTQAIQDGSVKISATDGNIIVKYDDGIYAKSSELTYDTGSNTLTFTDANGKSKPIKLNSIDTIKNIYFDKPTDSLVFVYTVDGEEKTVTIPASSFFNGIVGTNDGNVTVTTALTTDAQNITTTGITANLDVNKIISTQNSTVNLAKTTDNKISASVNIATNVPNNILEVDGSNSSLFVAGEASNITATYKDEKTDVQTVISKISSDIIDLTGEVNYISGSVHDSLIILNTHTDQIRVLSGDLATEIERATTVEKVLSGAIDQNTIEIEKLKVRVDTHDVEIKNLKDRVTAIEEKLESGFTFILKELERLDKKSTIVDDDSNDYIKHTFSVNPDTTSVFYGNTMVHTELSEDLSRDSDDGSSNDF